MDVVRNFSHDYVNMVSSEFFEVYSSLQSELKILVWSDWSSRFSLMNTVFPLLLWHTTKDLFKLSLYGAVVGRLSSLSFRCFHCRYSPASHRGEGHSVWEMWRSVWLPPSAIFSLSGSFHQCSILVLNLPPLLQHHYILPNENVIKLNNAQQFSFVSYNSLPNFSSFSISPFFHPILIVNYFLLHAKIC